MPAVRVVPCLDVKDGEVVKGVRFAGLRSVGSPIALAKRYDEAGADELVMLDIAATLEARETRKAWVTAVAREIGIPLTVGGGVRSVNDVRELLRSGADKIAINSAALERPELLRECAAEFGSQCVVLAADVRRDDLLGHRVFGKGGHVPTARSALEWLAEAVDLGVGEILLTSIDRDGTGEGFDLPLLRLASRMTVPLIASGGAGTSSHCLEALRAGADAVLVATLFHVGALEVQALKRYLAKNGLEVREP